VVTNDDIIAQRLQLIRNHAEAVVEGMGVSDLTNMIGYNFRLGEIECAIGISQLKKLQRFVESRNRVATRLNEKLADLPGLKTPSVLEGCSHVYYVYGMVLDTKLLGVKREVLIKALEAEGVKGLSNGYQNIHLLPIFQNKVAYGSKGFPWSSDICHREVSYAKGICPVAEKLHDETYIGFAMCLHDLTESDVDLIGKAFSKVWDFLPELRKQSIGH
jgi:dTDP-4-amino-4,6-dideoxygalactose transaminase